MMEEWIKFDHTYPSGIPFDPTLSLYFSSVEASLRDAVSPSTYESCDCPSQFFREFNQNLPLIYWSTPETAPGSVTMTLLTLANYSHGVGRYFNDICRRGLIPGTSLHTVIFQGISFRFKHNKEQRYFLCTITMEAKDEHDLEIIDRNIAQLGREIQLNLKAVEYTRQIASNGRLTPKEKSSVIQESLSSIMQREGAHVEDDLFDQMHRYLFSASGEERESTIRNSLTNLLNKRPEVFDPNLFNEFRKIISLVPSSFLGERDLQHLSRIIFYEYFFRKGLRELIVGAPTNRHLNFKVFQKNIHSAQGETPVVGVVLAMNLLHENEIFEEKHLFSALSSLVDNVEPVKDSYFLYDNRTDPLQTLYMEIKKRDGSRFSLNETKLLKRCLAREIHTRIESVYQPLFVYRNEEEVMRGIVDLTNQLVYVKDMPQVIITFQKQTQTEISFTVILLRLVKPDSRPIRELIDTFYDSSVKFNDFDSKIVGTLKRKKTYPKEAAVFEISFLKGPYIRKDYSVDLYKARHHAFKILEKIFGPVRDYNGGMISKQSEVLVHLKKLLVEKNLQNDHLVENFFYSLSPTYMQSLLSPKVLEHFFQLFNKSLELDYSYRPFSLMKEVVGGFTLIMIASPHHTFKNHIKSVVDRLPFASELTVSSHQFYDISTLGYLTSNHFKQDIAVLEETIEECLLSLQLENSMPSPARSESAYQEALIPSLT